MLFFGSSFNLMILVLAAAHHVRSFVPRRGVAWMGSTSSKITSTSRLMETKDDWTTDKVRTTFVNYFKERDHSVQPSSACAPLNDPTLLFTNAGMNQFKPIFLGQVDPNSPLASLKAATNSQKCIRAGGKHNDLEDVGRDTYHHTFFEMLGSWSFGDYFKKEAIDYAWDLLVNVYKLDPERIYATYFEGDDMVPCDEEARDFWLKYLPEERVIGCCAKDNFWEMGDVGPCGPCSEVHYDRIGGRDASALVNADDPDVIEIWNLVFIQFNREGPTELQTLPSKHIDTGMGLERLVSILQNKSSNYDIDCFQPLFDKLATLSQGKGPYTGKVGADDTDLKDTAYRAIADHARTLAFAIADGAVPNNEGRGYVLRRILRRATRYGQQILGCKSGFFAELIPIVVKTFGKSYPELEREQENIIQIVKEEERSFSSMLERGIKYFEDEIQSSPEKSVSGSKAFYMYDTLGFPIDLTELMAEEAGMKVDTDGFKEEMEAQKERSRQAQKKARAGGDGAPDLELQAEQTAWLSDADILPTDDGFKYKWDVELPATVMAVYTERGYLADSDTLEKGEFVGMILDKSSFYAEAGGQEADTGIIELVNSDGGVSGCFVVSDVQAYAGFLLHKGVIEEGSLRVGSTVNCKVDYERRRSIAPNHSMTHVLNAALRQVLGDSIDQRGSLCNDEKLRFDFSHNKAMKAGQLRAVEEFCQEVVSSEQPVSSTTMPLDEAKGIDGVRAVFGEVYPDPVRVVSIGDDTSVEFCGGTHVDNTAEAEAFVLLEETAVAKGTRRITAVTTAAAKEALKQGKKFETQLAEIESLDSTTADLDKLAGSIRKELDAAFVSAALKGELRGRIELIQKRASESKKKALQKRVDAVLNGVLSEVEKSVSADKNVMVLNVDIGADSKASQRIVNAIKKAAPQLAFIGLSEEEMGSGGKIMAFAIVPEDLIDAGLKADEWVRAALEPCGGRGGGKPGNAQGQAKECDDVAAVVSTAISFAEEKTGVTVA